MFVKDLVLTEPVYCLIDDYLQKSASLIAENNLICLPVFESLMHKNVIGVITEKVICNQAVAKGLDPQRTKVGRVMSCSYFTVTPETDVEECRRIMCESDVDFLFVTEFDNSCSGVVTKNVLPERELIFEPHAIEIQFARADRLF